MSALVCTGCGREVQWCAFCDEDECDDAICFRCVLYELDEARAPAPRTTD